MENLNLTIESQTPAAQCLRKAPRENELEKWYELKLRGDGVCTFKDCTDCDVRTVETIRVPSSADIAESMKPFLTYSESAKMANCSVPNDTIELVTLLPMH